MGNALQPAHLLILLLIIVVLFGASKLPALAKSMGQSARVFKKEMKAMKEDDAEATPATPADAQQFSVPAAADPAPAQPAPTQAQVLKNPDNPI